MKAVYGKTNPAPGEEGLRRCASVIGLKPEMEARYRELHADAWQGVLDRLEASNVRNYSIFVGTIDGRRCLFSYFEYDGTDFETDMQKIAADPETRRWWLETDPCQEPLPQSAEQGGRWYDLEPVFFKP